jgi:hypothetical protein
MSISSTLYLPALYELKTQVAGGTGTWWVVEIKADDGNNKYNGPGEIVVSNQRGMVLEDSDDTDSETDSTPDSKTDSKTSLAHPAGAIRRSVRQEPTKFCPHCGIKGFVNAVFCTSCGKSHEGDEGDGKGGGNDEDETKIEEEEAKIKEEEAKIKAQLQLEEERLKLLAEKEAITSGS